MRVPRWRTMWPPGRHALPSSSLTPRRLLLLSRPFRVLPPPFLCAIAMLASRLFYNVRTRQKFPDGAGNQALAGLDRVNLDAREVLPVARLAAVALLGLVREDGELRAAY